MLAQRQVKEHTNEQTALPILLEQVELAGCILSIDALGCLPKIARQIKEQDGEYVLARKRQSGHAVSGRGRSVCRCGDDRFSELVYDTHQTVDKAHGRRECRHYWTISDPTCIAYLNAKQTWTGLQSVVMVEAERRVGEQVSKECR